MPAAKELANPAAFASTAEALSLLKVSFLFRDVPEDVLQQLLSYFEVTSYLAGEPVFLEQEKSDHVYVIINGSVEIVKYSTQPSRMHRIIVFCSSESFSELSLLTQSNHSTSAFALEDTQLMQLNREVFLEILKKFPKVGFNLLRNLALLNRQVLQDKDPFESYREGFLQPHPQLTRLIPFAFIEQFQVVPLRYQHDVLLVGLRNPHNPAFFKAFHTQNPDINLKICIISDKDFHQLKKFISGFYSGHHVVLQFERAPMREVAPPLLESSVVGQLQNTKNFGLFSEELLKKLVELSVQKTYKSGEIVFQAGQESRHLFVILQGEVALRAQKPGGGSRHVTHYGTGEFMAEISLLLATPHNLTAQAVQDCQILLLSKEHFLQLLGLPHFVLALAHRLAKRLQRSNYLARNHQEQKVHFDRLPRLADLLPHHLLRRYKMIPLELNDHVLTIGCVDSDGESLFPILQRYLSHLRVELVSITEPMFQDCLRVMLNTPQKQTVTAVTTLPRSQNDSERSLPSDAVREIEGLIHAATRLRASDIHLEMQKEGMIFRFRIDGQLQEAVDKVSLETGRQIINRLKILSKLDIAESRMPQDGQMIMDSLTGTSLSAMRLSLIPTVFGEKAVLRLHKSDNALLPLDLLTPNRHTILKLREVVAAGEGVVLVAGPTGSGKTSTLYGMLASLNHSETNIIAVEDPVETIIPGITQIPVNEDIGRTYHAILKHILRQDPDIIMIGEIRDASSAQIAFEAAVTGHLVLTTVHATDSLNTLPRILELGVPQHMLSSGLSSVISQRLLRSICTECKVNRSLTARDHRLFQRYGTQLKIPKQLAIGNGCEHCRHSGYYDRIAVFELWQKSPKIHQLLLSDCKMPQIIDELRREGFQSLMEAGLQLAINGLTTLDEVVRNCPPPPF